LVRQPEHDRPRQRDQPQADNNLRIGLQAPMQRAGDYPAPNT
jgi:hypothetical protein